MYLSARHLRLGSGLVLLAYISLHLINHALGLWSLDLAERGLAISIALWQSVPGTILLYGAALLHFVLACRTVYLRPHWRLPITEWVRLWAGLSLPLLLIRHLVGTRVAVSLFHVEPTYSHVVANLIATGTQGWQMALLAPGWLHGCLGLWIGLRRNQAIYRAKPLLICLVALLPLLSALGFAHMSLQVEAMAGAMAAPGNAVTLAQRAALEVWRHDLLTAYVSLIVATFVAGQVRNLVERRGSRLVNEQEPSEQGGRGLPDDGGRARCPLRRQP
jgi:adenylate cyclase